MAIEDMSIPEIRRRLFPVFKAKPVRRAVLFGSVARGEADRLSDVDLVVDTGGKCLGLPLVELLVDVTEALEGTKVEMFEACEIRPGTPLARNIDAEGIVIYG
jgi:predicted nucleotidyltransferase